MKITGSASLLIGTLLLGSQISSQASAAQPGDLASRLDALEQENAAIRRENAALRENKRLREHNAGLRSSAPQSSSPVAPALEAHAPSLKPSAFDAMAADLPLAYKAHAADPRGNLQLWGEGGAIWSGGDPILQSGIVAPVSGLPGFPSAPYSFDLTPKVGWEAAGGFDYRFAASPWHVSGQFRYGEGRAHDQASAGGTFDPALLGLLGVRSGSGSESTATDHRETHWLADLAVGRDVIGTGRNALQVKGGLRIADFVIRNDNDDLLTQALIFDPPIVVSGIPVSSFSSAQDVRASTRASFLGAGPLIGLQGSAPLVGNWSFDYAGDAAILFGAQQSTTTSITTITASPAFLAFVGPSSSTSTSERFAYVLSADIQVGVSYWINPNIKIGGSYRLDALVNVQNQSDPAVTNFTPSRYTHGPRLTVTGQF